MKKSYIENKNLNNLSLEELVKAGIWRTLKNRKFKYQYIEDMADSHIQNVISTFMNTNNYVVLEAFGKELERRKLLADIQKQKITELRNQMSNDISSSNENQLEMTPIIDEVTSKAATDAADKIKSNPLNRIINPYPQCFNTGDLVENRYFILEVNSANRRGYTYKMRDTTTGEVQEIGQSMFLKKIGHPPVIKAVKPSAKKKSSRASSKKQSTAVKVEKTPKSSDSNHLVQKYNIGDTVGKHLIQKSFRSKKGQGGIAYWVKNLESNKEYRIKQSRLSGIHVPAKSVPNKFFNDPEAVVSTSVTSVVSEKQPQVPAKTLKDRLFAAWNALTK